MSNHSMPTSNFGAYNPPFVPQTSASSYAGYPFFAVQGGNSHRPQVPQTPQQFIQQLQQQQQISLQRQRAAQLELQRQNHELFQQQQTSPPMNPGSPGSSNGRKMSSKADRRAEHNAIERARRESLNTKFQELAHSLPNLQNDRRPSKGTIIERTLDFVKRTIIQEEKYQTEIQRLREQNSKLRSRLGSASQPNSPEPSISHAGSWMDEASDIPHTAPWATANTFSMQDNYMLFGANTFPDATLTKLSPSSPGSEDDCNSQQDDLDLGNLKTEDTGSLSRKSSFNLSSTALDLSHPFGNPFAMNEYGQHTP